MCLSICFLYFCYYYDYHHHQHRRRRHHLIGDCLWLCECWPIRKIQIKSIALCAMNLSQTHRISMKSNRRLRKIERKRLGKNAIFVYCNWTYTIYYKRNYFQFKFQCFLGMCLPWIVFWLSAHSACGESIALVPFSIYLFIDLSLKISYVLPEFIYDTFFRYLDQ